MIESEILSLSLIFLKGVGESDKKGKKDQKVTQKVKSRNRKVSAIVEKIVEILKSLERDIKKPHRYLEEVPSPSF